MVNFGRYTTILKSENLEVLASVSAVRQSKYDMNQGKKQARKQAQIEAHQTAAAQSILGSKLPTAPANPSSTNDADSHMTEEAQRRRNKKTTTRKARAQKAEAVLAANAEVFDSIDKDKVRANLVGLMGRPPAQIQNIRSLQGMSQSDGVR